MEKIKFEAMEEQSSAFGLDEELIPFIHIVGRMGEFTLCSQAITEYKYKVVHSKVDCPYCIQEIKFMKRLIAQLSELNNQK